MHCVTFMTHSTHKQKVMTIFVYSLVYCLFDDIDANWDARCE